VKKSENPRFYGQNKIFFENPALKPLGSFSHMAESELGVLGVHGKLMKYVVHSSKRKN
jgi:hypothetical protein